VTCQIAQVVAKTVYLLANPGMNASAADAVSVNCTLVDELYYCLTENFTCPLVSNMVSCKYSLLLNAAQSTKKKISI